MSERVRAAIDAASERDNVRYTSALIAERAAAAGYDVSPRTIEALRSSRTRESAAFVTIEAIGRALRIDLDVFCRTAPDGGKLSPPLAAQIANAATLSAARQKALAQVLEIIAANFREK